MRRYPKTGPASADYPRFDSRKGPRVLADPAGGNPGSEAGGSPWDLPVKLWTNAVYSSYRDRLKVSSKAVDKALSHLTGRPEEGILRELYSRYEHWVWDFPASESYHHPGPFGLVEHSMEVAAETLKELEERWCRQGGGGVLTPFELARWSRVAFALAFFHDCGKILDANFRPMEGCEPRNPLVEPLADYKVWHGFEEVKTITPYGLRRGRGLRGHERRGARLLPVLLNGPKGERILPYLQVAWNAYVCRGQPGVGPFPVPAEFLADLVHQADCVSARRGFLQLKGQREKGVSSLDPRNKIRSEAQ